MAKKFIQVNPDGTDKPKIKVHRKAPTPYVQKQSITDYLLIRDRSLYKIAVAQNDQATIDYFKEKYGVK